MNTLNTILSALLFTISALVGAVRAEPKTVPEISVPRVAQAISIDGQDIDPLWAKAASIALTDPWRTAESAHQKTTVFLAHDGATLFIAFDCEDRAIESVRTEHDDQTFRDDCVELFLAVAKERLSDAAALEINASGTLADYLYRHADWINYSWESRAKIAVFRKPATADIGYRVEIALQLRTVLAALQIEEVPKRIRANFARWDRGGDERFTIWSDPLFPYPHPHRPERYGFLVLE